MKKLTLIALFLFVGLASNSWALQYVGSLSYPSGGLTASTWTSATLSWTITLDEAKLLWTYSYELAVAGGGNISHVTFQVSDVDVDIVPLTGTGGSYELAEYAGGPADPGWPTGVKFWGIKWEGLGDSNTWNWAFETNRSPMLGNFYSVDGGKDTYLFNTGFETNPPDKYNLDAYNTNLDQAYALVPDTVVIPEPGTFLLLGTGLLGIAAIRYRRSKK